VLDGGELSFGLTLAIGALGAAAGAFVAARLVTRFGRRRVMVVAMGSQAALLAATASAPNVGVLMVISFAAGVPTGMWMPISRALQQRLTPNRLLGRVNVTGRIVSRGSMVGGSLFCGAIAAFASVRAAIGVGAAIQAIAVVLVWFALRGHDLEQPRSAEAQDE
jgi:MFS family permease